MMARKAEKVLAIVLAVSMCLSMLGVTAFAAEDAVEVDTAIGTVVGSQTIEEGAPVDNGDGTETVTVTVTVEASVSGEDGGDSVDYKEVSTDATTTTENGDFVRQEGSVSGMETATFEQTENVEEVSVTVVEDGEGQQEATGSAPGQAPTQTDNLEEVGGSDQEWSDLTTTSSTDRVVKAEADVGEIVEGSGEDYDGDKDIGLDPVNPDAIDGKKQVTGASHDVTDEELAKLLAGKDPALEGYEFIYVGHGEDSFYGAHWNLNDEFGGISLYSDGESTWRGWDYGCGTSQFQLVDPTDPDSLYTAYCADIDTGAKLGWWYKVQNLEDSAYYQNNDAEDHIRAVVLNGYWGTVGTEIDGSGREVPKTGSLAALKDTLNSAIDAGALTNMTKEDVAALTEGQALTATQMAVWKYGNPYEEITLGANTYDSKWKVNDAVEALGNEAITKELERINAVANYLMGLTMSAEEAGATTIINEKNFIEDLVLTVGSKAEGHPNNQNESRTDDAYDVDLSFSLMVTPSAVNDDLIVRVVGADGALVASARIAGTPQEGEGFGYAKTVTENGKTYYVLEDLTLIEGSNTRFDLRLEGAQYLEQGVYVYSSEERDGEHSQTFVGIAEGYREVDVSMSIDLSFNVEESTVTTERIWRNVWVEEGDSDWQSSGDALSDDPDDEGDEPDGNEPTGSGDPALVNVEDDPVPLGRGRSGGGDGLLEILDEEVPLAAVPTTGDPMVLWMALSALSGAGYLCIKRKKD